MAKSAEQFAKAVIAAGLSTAEAIKALWGQTPAEKRPKDGPSFSKLLIEEEVLTEFQAAEILAGRETPLVLGDYVLLDRIGAGGMGQVFKARHRHMKRTVAIKLLPPELTKDEAAVKRFQREVEAAAKLAHPNIVQAYDASVQRGVWYLVMEFVEGQDLSAVAKRAGKMPVAQVVEAISQAARGLGFAHSKGVIHRDIKPANLLLDAEGTVKILDMGLARMDAAKHGAQEGLTQSGQVMGTVDYMAPEQAFDIKAVDARADIYSLGCTLYRLLTGENLFDGETIVQKLMAHQQAPAPSLAEHRPDVPAALDAIYQQMVAKRPDDRFQSMADVEAALLTLNSVAPQTTSSGTKRKSPLAGNNVALLSPVDEEHAPVDGFAATISAVHPLQSTDPLSNRSINVAQHTVWRKPIRKLPLWKQPAVLVGGGVGALLLVVLAVWMIVRAPSGKEAAKNQGSNGTSPKTSVVERKPTPTPNVAPPIPTPPKPTPTPAPTGGGFVDLFNGRDLTGWSSRGGGKWSASNGVLTGRFVSSSGWLASDKDYSDFELDCEYKINRAGNSGIFLRADIAGDVTGRNFHELQLCDDANLRIGSLTNGTGGIFNQIAPNPKPTAPSDTWHRVQITVIGDALRVVFNGTTIIDAPFKTPRPRSGRIGFQSHDAGTVVEFRNIRVRELNAIPTNNVGWRTLFTNDLEGWSGRPGLWKVSNGTLVGDSGPSGVTGDNTFLTSPRNYQNFEMEFSVRLNGSAKVNSGLQIRSEVINKAEFVMRGPQVDIGAQFWGSLYGEKMGKTLKDAGPDVIANFKPNEFNEVRCRVVGKRVTLVCNGKTSIDSDVFELPSDGFLGFQIHNGPPYQVEFKNVRLRELDAAGN